MKEFEKEMNDLLKTMGFDSLDSWKKHQLKQKEEMQKGFNNEYLRNCDLDHIDIWELQQSLKEKDLVEIDFKDDARIVITKNEVYVKRWSPAHMPVDCFKIWYEDMYNDYDTTDYIQLTNDNYDTSDWIKMIKRLIEKCNYTLNGHYKKESILKKIAQNYE